MPEKILIPEEIDPEFEIAGCEMELEDLARNEKFGRWVAAISVGVFIALREYQILDETILWWILGLVGVVFVATDIKAEVKRQGIHTRVVILQGYMSSEKQANRRWMASAEASGQSHG